MATDKATKLSEVVTLIGGTTPSTKNSEYWGGEIPWVTTTEMTACDGQKIAGGKRSLTELAIDGAGAKTVRAGATLLGTTATIGTTAMADRALSFNQQITALVRKDDRVSDEYLFYWAQSQKELFESRAVGTAFRRIATSTLRAIEIALPPKETQHRVVTLLASADRYIVTLQAQLAESKELLDATVNTLVIHPEDTFQNLSQALTPSPERVAVVDGQRYPAVGVQKGGMGVLEREDFAGGETSYRWLTPVHEGQLVVRSITSWEAPTAVVGAAHEGFHVSSVFPVYDIDNSVLLPGYMSIVSRSKMFAEQMRNKSKGTVLRRMTISNADFMSISIALPDLEVQQAAIETMKAVESYVTTTQTRLRAVEELRTQLLHDLLSGNHAIPESYDALLGATT
jgi:type I restriction enzyme S subunit